MTGNRVKAAWAEGRAAVVGWLHLPSVHSAEALAGCGYDGLIVDLQHGFAEMSDLGTVLMAIHAGGAEPGVRVAGLGAAETMKTLDLGAGCVIAPLIEGRDEAAAFASSLHYPPRGSRSWGPRRPLLRYGGDYFERASESVVSFAMVETRAGLENLDEIAAVDGIDGIFVGPSDLSLALSQKPGVGLASAEIADTVEHVRSRCKAAGKRLGMFCGSGTQGREAIAAGFDLVSIAPDLSILVQAARADVVEARR